MDTNLSALIVECTPELRNYVSARIPSHLASTVSPDDILQDVWLIAATRPSAFDVDSVTNLRAWLRTIARNCLIDVLRRAAASKRSPTGRRFANSVPPRSSYVNLFDTIVGSSRTPSSMAAGDEAVNKVKLALSGLPDEQNRAISLHYLNGLDRTEVARQLNKSPAAINGLITRALVTMREMLSQ
jgi:RNA polymerase sigma-70 factor (subfamily 1)